MTVIIVLIKVLPLIAYVLLAVAAALKLFMGL